MTAYRKITPEKILDAAYAVFCREGMEKVSARQVAREAGCSTQPLFSCFTNMEEVRGALEKRVVGDFHAALEAPRESEDALLDWCRAYVRFAGENRRAFYHLFSETNLGPEALHGEDGLYPRLVEVAVRQEGPDEGKAREHIERACLYANGLAFLLANGSHDLTADEACRKLEETIGATRKMIRG